MHGDYHRPSDELQKLDVMGMSSIALWLEEATVYLASRDQALRVTLANAVQRDSTAVSGARQASLGTIPEFNYAGQGVQISGVSAGGAAELAGLQAQDILLQFNGEPIVNLQEYSNFIRGASPGDIVRLQYQRGTQIFEVELELQAR
jgi:S1-C subfamily serine protease